MDNSNSTAVTNEMSVISNAYGTIITAIGEAKIAACILNGTKINVNQAAAGDGGGAYYKPTKSQTELINECWRGDVAAYELNSKNKNMIDVLIVVPNNVGGFCIREMALIDSDGDTIAICNLPDIEKVATGDGINGTFKMLMHILVTDSSVLEFTVNSSLDTISREEMEEYVAAVLAAYTPSIIIEPSFVVPTEGWGELETPEVIDDADYAYRLKLEVEGSTEEHYPELNFNKASKTIASDAGLCPVIETQDGVIVLWSKTVPSAELTGTLILIRPSGGSGAGNAEPYILPAATAGTLGGVKIPSNSGLVIDAQGNLRVNKSSNSDVDDSVDDIFGEGTGSGSDSDTDTDTDTGDESDSSGTTCEHEVATDEEVQTEIEGLFGQL